VFAITTLTFRVKMTSLHSELQKQYAGGSMESVPCFCLFVGRLNATENIGEQLSGWSPLKLKDPCLTAYLPDK
jgi:hypothetical protein